MKNKKSGYVEIVQVNSRGKEVRTFVRKAVAKKQKLFLANDSEPSSPLLFGGLLGALYSETE